MMMVGTVAPARPAGKNGEKAAPVQSRSFICGSRQNDKADYDTGNVTLTTSEQRLPAYQVSPSGYLRGIYLLCELTAVNTTVTTVAYQEDAPFNVLSVIRFLDTNSRPFIGTITGYDLYLLNKYGGYNFQGDAEMSATYSATSGTALTAGSGAFILFLPLEICARNALGSQLNKSGAAQFTVEMYAAGTGTVFSTAPATSTTLRVRSVLASWLDPEATDARGNPVDQTPPFLNTTQRWEKQVGIPISAGDRTLRLQGIDGLVRSIIFIARRSSSTRANGETDWPDPFSMKYEESYLIQSRPRLLFRWMIAMAYGYSAANDAAGGRDAGVYPIFEWMTDFNHKPGNELTRKWLPMSSASNLEIQGSWGNAVTLDILVNKVVPFPQGEVKGLAVL
jgi:hypothetical protein